MKEFILSLIFSLCIVSQSYCVESIFSEQKVIGKIEILEDGHIQIREDIIILKNGVEITRTYHRRVISPTDDISKEDAKIKAIAEIVQTKEIKDKYAEKMKNNLMNLTK